MAPGCFSMNQQTLANYDSASSSTSPQSSINIKPGHSETNNPTPPPHNPQFECEINLDEIPLPQSPPPPRLSTFTTSPTNKLDTVDSFEVLEQTIMKQKRLARLKNTDLRMKVLLKRTFNLVCEIMDRENGFDEDEQEDVKKCDDSSSEILTTTCKISLDEEEDVNYVSHSDLDNLNQFSVDFNLSDAGLDSLILGQSRQAENGLSMFNNDCRSNHFKRRRSSDDDDDDDDEEEEEEEDEFDEEFREILEKNCYRLENHSPSKKVKISSDENKRRPRYSNSSIHIVT